MAKRLSREEILSRLKKTIMEEKPIIGAGCSAGIVAKCAEMGGADLILVYSTGKSRLQGLPTTLIPNSNKVTLEMFEEIQNVVKDTPIIAGIEATEPPRERNLSALVKSFIDTGFSGIINFPTVGFIPPRSDWRKEKEVEGLGFSREVEMILLAHRMDVFTMAYVFYPQDARAMAKAGVDCMVPHVGATAGGIAGYEAISRKAAATRIQKMIESARKVNSDIICLGHGGPFATPEDTRYLYVHTEAVGFVGASSIERIPIERAVKGVVTEFKDIQVGRKEKSKLKRR